MRKRFCNTKVAKTKLQNCNCMTNGVAFSRKKGSQRLIAGKEKL